MHALVTGGAGFIGSNLVDALIARNWRVSVIDNLSTGQLMNLESAVAAGAVLYEASVTDAGTMHELLGELGPDVVFHLAAQVDVRRAVSDPFVDAQVNVGGTAAVLEAARAAGAQRVVLASTGGALYGEADLIPTPEDAPIAPLSPYGASKAAAESYLALYRRLHGLSTLSLRLANVYGARQDPLGEGGVVAIMCGATVSGRPATVFGDGSQTRDFVFVGDVAAAFLAAAESDVGGAFNVGTGVETSVLDLVGELGLEPHFEPARPGEVARSCLAASAIREALGWSASTSLRDGLEQTLAWVRG